MRTWRDTAGKFSIEAKLIEVTGDSVRLLKMDGKTIDVPLAKLSRADSDYIKSKTESENPFADPRTDSTLDARLTTIPSFDTIEPLSVSFSLQSVPKSQDLADLPDKGSTVLMSKSTECEPLMADPAGPRPAIKPGQALVAPTDAYDSPSELITISSRHGLVAISIGRALAGMKDPHVGKLLVGQLPKGPFKLVVERDESIQLMDHNESTGQTLMMSDLDGFKRGGDMTIIEGLAEGTPVERYRRRLPGIDKPGFKPQVTRARLIDKDIVVAIVDSVLYCWNLKTSTLLYRTENNSVTGQTKIAFSGGGKFMAVPHDKGFSLLETATGEDRGFVETDSQTTPGLVFHPDGRRIAYSSSNSWGVWDCVSAKSLISNIVTEHLGDKLIGWFGNDWFMTDLGNVIDAKSQLLVWFYYTGATEDRQLWKDTISVVSKLNGLKIDTLPIPDKKALAAVKKLDQQKNLMVTAPGTEVRVQIESTENVNKEELLEAMKTSIERAGWKIDPSAKLTVVAKIGRGKAYHLQYTMSSIGSAAAKGPAQTVEIKPFTALLEIRSGKEVLWSRATENHVPPFLFLRGQETVQEAVKKYERPQAEFFSGLQIPPRIPKRELVKGLGASRLDKGVWVDFSR